MLFSFHVVVSGLKPYRPAGSNDVYYVEVPNDDAVSVTTIESTHTGMEY